MSHEKETISVRVTQAKKDRIKALIEEGVAHNIPDALRQGVNVLYNNTWPPHTRD